MNELYKPAGYELIVTSWENDADCYMTNSLSGLNGLEVALFVDLCKLHYSRNGRGEYKGFGNLYDPDEDEIEAYTNAVVEVYNKHDILKYCTSDYFGSDFDANDREYVFDVCRDIIHDLFGYGNEGFYTRVLESYKVVYFDKPVMGQIVTEKFP